MKIPIYYQALWGTSYQIIPDSLFIDGPAEVGFDTSAFVASHNGWLKNYSDYVADQQRSGAEIVDYVATNYSVSPRLLLALLEYQLGALSQPVPPENLADYPLGEVSASTRTLYRQLAWAANILNNGYYQWRAGDLKEIDLPGGLMERPDPWQNAATVALHFYASLHMSFEEYTKAVSADGFAATFRALYGDPWATPPHIPGSLRQPSLRLPFEPGKIWAFTGGPHNPWGENAPFAALDFAPPSVVGGCADTEEFATAVADGIIVRTGPGISVLDLDGDHDERTGWVIFYLHLAAKDMLPVGSQVTAGQPIGHPSCEGGHATGTHVHIARKYNGEWVLADGLLAFNLEGWVTRKGAQAYMGSLIRQGRTVTACVCSDQSSQLQAEFH
jgi:LasA protease